MTDQPETPEADKTLNTGDAGSVGFGVVPDDTTTDPEKVAGAAFAEGEPVKLIATGERGRVATPMRTKSGHFVYRVKLIDDNNESTGEAICGQQDLERRSIRAIKRDPIKADTDVVDTNESSAAMSEDELGCAGKALSAMELADLIKKLAVLKAQVMRAAASAEYPADHYHGAFRSMWDLIYRKLPPEIRRTNDASWIQEKSNKPYGDDTSSVRRYFGGLYRNLEQVMFDLQHLQKRMEGSTRTVKALRNPDQVALILGIQKMVLRAYNKWLRGGIQASDIRSPMRQAEIINRRYAESFPRGERHELGVVVKNLGRTFRKAAQFEAGDKAAGKTAIHWLYQELAILNQMLGVPAPPIPKRAGVRSALNRRRQKQR